MRSKYQVIVYSDYDALKLIIKRGQIEKKHISNQLDRLGEYNFKLYYRVLKDQYIRIIDELSRILIRLQSILKQIDQDRMAMATIKRYLYFLRIIKHFEDRLAKYTKSLIYYQLFKYLREEESTLKELKLSRNRRKYLR